jgi:hypothetical protein
MTEEEFWGRPPQPSNDNESYDQPPRAPGWVVLACIVGGGLGGWAGLTLAAWVASRFVCGLIG